MINALAKLVSFRSVSSELESIDELFNFLESTLNIRKLSVQTHRSSNYPSMVITTRNTKRPKLLLQAHMDIVPAPDRIFKMTENNGRLYGRGVYDMKFAAACYMQLVEDLKDELDQYDFGIMLTSDEEIGGENGVGYLLKQGYSAEVCILPDGGDDWKLEATSNGIWMISLAATGATAHGSRPWDGDNAIDRLTDCITEIRQTFGTSKPHGCTLTVSQIKGGAAINQVPDFAEATLDMRFPSQENYAACRTRVEKIATKHNTQIETVVQLEGAKIDTSQPYIAKFMRVAEQVRGRPTETCHSLGATDARYFHEHGIPTIVIRPIGGGHHGDNEWIDKAELEIFYQVLKAYVQEVAHI